MASTEVEKFLGAGHVLADRNNLPTRKGQHQEQFDASEITKVVFGRMLAQVAIVPMPIDRINLICYGGDEVMLRAITGRIEGRILKLEGEIPFKPGGGRGHHSFGSNVFIGNNVTITSGSFSGGDTIILNGREVDLDRAIQLVLIVPPTMNIKVSGLIGAVGITDHLDATLDFSPSVQAELVARSVQALIGDISGSGKVTLDSVTEDAELEVSGSGKFRVGSVGGNVYAKVSGSGDIVIRGGTSRGLRASVSGSGDVRHKGTITGDARLRVSGSGDVTVTNVKGEVDRSISGSGSITVNGCTYSPRW